MRLVSLGIYQQLSSWTLLVSHHRALPSTEGFPSVQPVCCWSKSSISSLLLWCFSLLWAGWVMVLLLVWKGCWEPSQALKKYRNCRCLCSASASLLSPVGWGKRAGYDIQLQDERNKCGIPPFVSWHITFILFLPPLSKEVCCKNKY